MNPRWKMFLDSKPWDRSQRLFMVCGTGFVQGLQLVERQRGQVMDTPTMQESYEETRDNVGDVTGFLQAALDCAWEAGMRPTGAKDNTSELAAVRYHLEDMRALALPKAT